MSSRQEKDKHVEWDIKIELDAVAIGMAREVLRREERTCRDR